MSKHDRLLLDQKRRLEKVIREDAFVCTTNIAKRYLARVQWWLDQPEQARELAAGEMGPNGLGPAIDSVCKDAEHHARLNREARKDAA